MIVCRIGQRGAFQGLLSAARAARRADYKFGMTSFQNVSKKRKKERREREREDSNNKFIEHASHTFSCTPLFFLVRLSRRRRDASRRVLRKLCQRKRRATFALAMLIVGVNKQFRRVRQSEMHKTWEAGKLTGSSSALKFAISYVFRFQIVFITIFFYFEI